MRTIGINVQPMDIYNALRMHYIAGWFASLRSQLKCQLLERPFSGFGLPWYLSGKESIYQCRRFRRPGFNPWVRKIPWRRKWQPTPIFLPGESHRQRSLASYIVHGAAKSWTWLSNWIIHRNIGIICTLSKVTAKSGFCTNTVIHAVPMHKSFMSNKFSEYTELTWQLSAAVFIGMQNAKVKTLITTFIHFRHIYSASMQ